MPGRGRPRADARRVRAQKRAASAENGERPKRRAETVEAVSLHDGEGENNSHQGGHFIDFADVLINAGLMEAHNAAQSSPPSTLSTAISPPVVLPPVMSPPVTSSPVMLPIMMQPPVASCSTASPPPVNSPPYMSGDSFTSTSDIFRCPSDDISVHVPMQICQKIWNNHYINLALLLKGSVELLDLCSGGGALRISHDGYIETL